MIEIEPMNSIFTDEQLLLVLSLCGQECHDKLLYEGEYDGRVPGVAASNVGIGIDLVEWPSLGAGSTQDQGFRTQETG